jgi:hypothetical protein
MSKLGMSLAYFSIIVFLKTCSTNQGISGWSKGSCAYRSRMGAQTWDAKLRKTLKNCASGLSKLSHHSPFIAFHSCNKAYPNLWVYNHGSIMLYTVTIPSITSWLDPFIAHARQAAETIGTLMLVTET